ncbi:MAG: 16S rRNA (guanine(966)-N(2))-methyltransferase RsmD [Rhizobiaceae bacterium]
MRIVGGKFRGRALAAPQSMTIRPTSDRVRESLFNILAHAEGFDLEGARVLDLFAGTGALGIEALSRGAKFCLFVDEGAEARGLIRDNMEAFGLNGCSRLFRRDATGLGPTGTMGEFDLVFADPPYRKGMGEKALHSAANGGWLKPQALIVLEEAADAQVALGAQFAEFDRRDYGETTIRLARWLP